MRHKEAVSKRSKGITGDLIDSSTTDFRSVFNVINKIMEIASLYCIVGNHEARNKYYKSI